MRITYIAAGAAGSYCGACSHDTTLARGLCARGQHVEFIPLYTPVQSDLPPPGQCSVFYGGITTYLEQHSAVFRHTPMFIDRLFNSPWMLRLASRFALSTRPEDLGEMTVSVLRGPEGSQKKELYRLVRYLAEGPRPDIVSLSNTLLSSIAPAIAESMGVPVVCSLQGEESFIRRLGDPWREEAIRLIRANGAAISRFISPSLSYVEEMMELLDVSRERIAVVRPGIDTSLYTDQGERPPHPFRIGCLSRVAKEKGTDLLVEAFRRLEEKSPGRAHLALAGQARGHGQQLIRDILRNIDERGLVERFSFLESPGLRDKIEFLRSCSVFALASRIPERRGTACLEAMSMGVPILASPCGVLREIIDLTGGGVPAPTDEPAAFAETLATLCDTPDEVARLGRNAAAGVRKHFAMQHMVDATLSLYEEVR